jgi:hypothetical protein
MNQIEIKIFQKRLITPSKSAILNLWPLDRGYDTARHNRPGDSFLSQIPNQKEAQTPGNRAANCSLLAVNCPRINILPLTHMESIF